MTRMGIPFPLSERARPCAGGWIDRCPAHDDRAPSLSLKLAPDGRLLLFCHAGCRFEDILAAAGLSRHAVPRASLAAQRELAAHDAAERQRNRARAILMWQQGVPIAGTLAENYLVSRGIFAWGADQRFHPELWHYPSNQHRPALISPILRDEAFIGVHRTFLDDAGQKIDRMMLGDCKGGAVRLGGSGERLVVAEGIETTLSLRQLTSGQNGQFWAALSAVNMAELKLPPKPGELVVGADGDKAGREAAQVLCERAARAGWKASVLAAPDGKDFNDILTEQVQHERRH